MSDEEEYTFQLIQFRQSAKKGIFDVDIVPSTWLSWDDVKKACIIQYPPPPYNAKTCMYLQRIVQEKKLPPKKWPVWEVDIKGGADTYDTAVSRLDNLRTAKFAYTTGAESDVQDKSTRATERIKKKTMAELFNLSEENNENDEPWLPLSPSMEKKSSSDGSLSASERSPKKKLKLLTKKKKKASQKKQNVHKDSLKSELSDGSEDLVHKATPAIPLPYADTNNNQRSSEVKTKSSRINLLPPTRTSVDNPTVIKHVSGLHSASILQSNEFNESEYGESTSPPPILTSVAVDGKKSKSNDRVKPVLQDVCAIQKGEQSSMTYAVDKPFAETLGKGLSKDTLFIVSVLKGLSIDMQAHTAAINALHDALKAKQIIAVPATVQNFEQEYGVTLPFKTLGEFEEFDERLNEHKTFHDGFIASLNQLLDRNNNMSKSMTSILRKFFARDVIMCFTAKKKIDGKTLLKTTKFGISLIATLTNFHTRRDGSPVDADEVLTRAGNAISNAKDWDGRDRTAKPH